MPISLRFFARHKTTNPKADSWYIGSVKVSRETIEKIDMASASDDAIKAECRKVAEALRYSNPMSSSVLASAESQISVKFADLFAAVAENDKDKSTSIAKDLLVLIDDKNRKCKLLK